MKTKDKEKNRKIDLIIKIVLIIIIIILLIHNCMLCKNKHGQNIIDINCDGGQCEPAPTATPIPPEIENISFSQDKISIIKGDTQDLIIIIEPTELSASELAWSSSDSSVVSVDSNGTVKGLKVGKSTITVRSINGKIASCVVEVVSENIPVKNIRLKPKKTTINVGSSSQIIATIEPSNATNRALVWTSSNPSIATVNSKGIVRGLKNGTVTITAKTKDGKVVASTTIKIEMPPKQIENLTFAQKNVSVKKGESLSLIVMVTPTELSSSKLVWKSNDTSIVSVDENGVVKGINVGKAIVTVTSSNGKTATCVVEVTTDTVEVKEIVLKPNDNKITTGSTTQIAATIIPENATNRELVWTSSDPTVATVDDKGIVKGLKSGTVTITAKTKDGKVVAKTTITIEKSVVTPTPTPMQIESLNFAQKNVSVKKGDSLGLIVTITPTELSSEKLTWTSSDSTVVSVDENGVVTGVKVGTATITVKSSNGKTATCTVEVTTNTIPVSEIQLNPSNVEINVGEQTQIEVTIVPENATDREIIWTSSNDDVVTVDSNGVITGIGAGNATITVKTKDGQVVATSTVTVNVPVTPTPTPTVTPTPTGFNVFDNEKPPVVWNGSSDLKIFTNSLNGPIDVIAPESKNTYQFTIQNNSEYNMKYTMEFHESNDSHINMKYKLKKNGVYIIDHYVSCTELIVAEQLINNGSEDIYNLEWYWESSANDTEIGADLASKYGLQIKIEAESLNG